MHSGIGYNTAGHLFQPVTLHLNPEPNRAATDSMLPSQTHHYPQPHVPSFRTQLSRLLPPPLPSFASKDIRYDSRAGSRKSLYSNSPVFLRDDITTGVDVGQVGSNIKDLYTSQLDGDRRNMSSPLVKRSKRDSNSSGTNNYLPFVRKIYPLFKLNFPMFQTLMFNCFKIVPGNFVGK